MEDCSYCLLVEPEKRYGSENGWGRRTVLQLDRHGLVGAFHQKAIMSALAQPFLSSENEQLNAIPYMLEHPPAVPHANHPAATT